MFKTLMLIALLLPFYSYAQCVFGLGKLDSARRAQAGSYYKRFDPYVRGEVNAPTKDLLYAMFLGHKAQIQLTWSKYSELEKKIDQVPGEQSYLSPTLKELRPTIYKYLTNNGADEIEVIDEIAKKEFETIERLFSEITNGVSYEVVSPDWKLLTQEEYNSLFPDDLDTSTHFLNSECGRITNISLGNVSRYLKLDEEEQEMSKAVFQHREFMEFVSHVLPSSSYLKSQINRFLNQWAADESGENKVISQ